MVAWGSVMETINLAVMLVAGLALVSGLFAHWVRLHWLNQPLLALVLGVLVGPAGLGWISLDDHGGGRELLEVAARFTLAVALVSVGLELRGSLREQVRPLAVLVLGGAALMWAASSLLVGLLLGLDPLPAFLLGAVLAPIDPILAASVSTGRVARENLPERIRHLLTGESSARHGLGLVFVMLPALLLTRRSGESWTHWLTATLLWQGVAAVAIGAALGFTTGRAQRWSSAHDFAEAATGPLVAVLPVLALAVVSALELLGSDGLLGVLAAGVAFAWARTGPDKGEALERQERLHEQVLKQVLQLPVFFLLGAALPWSAWAELGWAAPALVVATLLLRPIPALLLLKPLVGAIRTRDEALFVGWFGPIGVGALYLATTAHKETHVEAVWTVTTLLVAATVIVHDITTTPLSRWLDRRQEATAGADAAA